MPEVLDQAAQQLSAFDLKPVKPEFEAIDEDRYRLTVPGCASFEVDYLRRKGGQLVGELLVRTNLPGARTYDGVLSVGDFNLSSTRIRQAQARYLEDRSQAGDLDWTGWLEEFSQRVIAAERAGQPSIPLHEVPIPDRGQPLEVDGFPLLDRHPVCVFGDGGAGKSSLGLYVAGELSSQGLGVGYCDWELAGEDQKNRLLKMYPSKPPWVEYIRCDRPLTFEAERIRRITREKDLDYLIFDSVAFASDGPPEAAETAARYFQAMRRIGPLGSLHIAHVSKSFDGADRKPFGSVFWFNGFRACWNLKIAESPPDEAKISIALHCRKFNLGAPRPSLGFEFRFDSERTSVHKVDVAEVPDLAAGLSITQRVWSCLRAGPKTKEEIASELEDVKPDSLRRTLNRGLKTGKLVRFPGAEEKISLPHPEEA